MSPARVERCVDSLMKDPNFKARKPGQDKKSAAYALCTWMDQQGRLKESSEGVVITAEKVEAYSLGPFKVVLPISAAKRVLVEKSDGGEQDGLWLRVSASGPERDSDDERMSAGALEKMVGYVERGWNGSRVPFLDGHYRDLMAAVLGDLYTPGIDENGHFGFDVKIDENNPFAVNLFNDVLTGKKKHGASIAGIIQNVEYEELGEGRVGIVFNDVEIIEVSRTSWPSWRPSFITLLARNAGKVTDNEYEAVLKRKQEIIDLRGGVSMTDMVVRSADGSEEVWTDEMPERNLIVKITSPHGWDKKFAVSNAPWSSVKDRSKPCQFAIVKTGKDGEFSMSASGYPHHQPDCGTVNRGGVIAAAVRLIQALKSSMPEIEIPPVVTLGIAAIGEEELDSYLVEMASRFSREELIYAARHILNHYRRDLDMELPENLVAIAKSVDYDDPETVAEIVRDLVKCITSIKKMEVDMPGVVFDEEVPENVDNLEETIPDETLEQAGEETVTEPVTEAEPVVEQEAAVATEEVIVEPEPTIEKKNESLASVVDGRLLSKKFGELVRAAHEMIFEAINAKDLARAYRTIDEFSSLAKDTAAKIIASGERVTEAVWHEVFAEKIELEKGQLSKSRVARMDQVIESVTAEMVALRDLMKNANVLDDTVVEQVAEKTAKAVVEAAKSAERTALEARMEKVETQSREQLEKVAQVLVAQQEPAVPKGQETRLQESPGGIPPEAARTIFMTSLEKRLAEKKR